MGNGIYVLAVLGESPAVLSELLWWLAARERQPLAGIEAWTTGRGAEHLRDLVATEAWQALQSETGPLPALRGDGAEPAASYGFRIHHFVDQDHRPLNDVRTKAEAELVSARLHDRVRSLRSELPDDIRLLGSLAGGRKTVSAALHTAFCLQAGANDRLVHVLLEAGFESWLREHGELRNYVAPSQAWEQRSGVPRTRQVDVYDILFPRLKYLLPRRLSDVLDHLDWGDVWPALDANMGRNARGELIRRGYQSWTYTIVDQDNGEPVHRPIRLGQRAGAILAAMATIGEQDPSTGDLVAWLDDNEVGWKPPAAVDELDDGRTKAISSAVSKLRTDLEGLPVGLERFAPLDQGFCLRGRVVAHLDFGEE